MRARLLVLLAALVAAVLPGSAGASVLPTTSTAYGADISWPNCAKGLQGSVRPSLGLPMPTRTARFVVIGLTDGPGFSANPCLASQVAWVRARHLWAGAYAVTSYPTAAQLARYGGRGTTVQRLRSAGAAEARLAVARMHRAGLRPPVVWVDVEPVRSAPWSSSTVRNNAVVDGALAAYRAAGLRVGLYSYASAWRSITGGRQLRTVPTWVPSGGALSSSALARCRQRSFSGGPVYLAQWTVADRDRDVACAGVPRVFRSLFAGT